MNESFEGLRRLYRERASMHVCSLEKAFSDCDRQAITSIAHKLHGSGVSFGFPRITVLAQALETASESGEPDNILRTLAEPLLAELTQIAQAV